MQTASTNICERMGHSQELSGFQCGTVIGYRDTVSQSLRSSKLHVAFRLAQEQCVKSFMEWVSMAEQLQPYITKCNAKRWMQWCKARRHWTLEQWRRVLWSDESRFSLWQSDGGVWVFRLPGERYFQATCMENPKVFDVMCDDFSPVK